MTSEPFEIDMVSVTDDPAVLPVVEVIRVEPGDVIVVRTAERLDDAGVDAFVLPVRQTFPRNMVLLLTGGDEIGVLRPADGAPPPLPDKHTGEQP